MALLITRKDCIVGMFLKMCLKGNMQVFSSFLNPHPRMRLLIVDIEEGGGERETSIICLQYASRLGIEPTTF